MTFKLQIEPAVPYTKTVEVLSMQYGLTLCVMYR